LARMLQNVSIYRTVEEARLKQDVARFSVNV
jgi:hypothetical protein